ncbi:hypothetical protein Pelo_15479 [Pelomyxa schiedti]|nr:hypothetical protein Pelo_15479 [Pelomyxa schiedti]
MHETTDEPHDFKYTKTRFLEHWRQGGGFISLCIGIVVASEALAFGFGYLSTLVGLILGLAVGPTALVVLWCIAFKNRTANAWFFNNGKPARHTEQVYPTVICSSNMIFILLVGPVLGVFCAPWLLLHFSDTAVITMDSQSGAVMSSNYTDDTWEMEFYNYRLGLDSIIGSEHGGSADGSSVSTTCAIPVLGRLEYVGMSDDSLASGNGYEPRAVFSEAMFFATCELHSATDCASDAARHESPCVDKWYDDGIRGALKRSSQDQKNLHNALDDAGDDLLYPYIAPSDAVAVQWLDVDQEEYMRSVTFYVLVTVGNFALVLMCALFFVVFYYRRKAQILSQADILAPPKKRHHHRHHNTDHHEENLINS